MLDIPPSIWKIWPVTQADFSVNKNAAALATSIAAPIFFNGWRCALFSTFSGVFKIWLASGVWVIEGATQLTLILGASSAANAFVKPSIAPFEDDTIEWKLKPVCTATVENSTIEAVSVFFNLGKHCWIVFLALPLA